MSYVRALEHHISLMEKEKSLLSELAEQFEAQRVLFKPELLRTEYSRFREVIMNLIAQQDFIRYLELKGQYALIQDLHKVTTKLTDDFWASLSPEGVKKYVDWLIIFVNNLVNRLAEEEELLKEEIDATRNQRRADVKIFHKLGRKILTHMGKGFEKKLINTLFLAFRTFHQRALRSL